MMRAFRYLPLLALAAGLAAGAPLAAQTGDAAAAQNPAPIHTFEIEGGGDFHFDAGRVHENYYRISYSGVLLGSKGTPFKEAQGLDLAAPAITEGAGDRNAVNFRYEKGTAKLGGELVEALGAMPLTLRGLEKLHLRGTALLASDLDGKNVQIAAGLETPPLRIPGFQHSTASNWLVFGVNAQHQEQVDSNAGDANFGLATYRAFLGRAFGWRKSADVAKTAAKLAETILAQAPDLDTAKKLEPAVRQIPASQRTGPQQLLLDALGEEPDPGDWARVVRDLAVGDTDAVLDQPTFSLYAEASGWYQFNGGTDSSKFKNLVTVTLDYWPLPQNDALFVRARYETGYERAAPTVRKNHLLGSVALRF